MAQTMFMSYPLDRPRVIRPGVLYREADWHGGSWPMATTPEMPDRARAGDLSMTNIKGLESRALTSPGAPYILKR
jgi:hypothetical protein